ncbi:unnamed protein product [Ceutorhynchus assimilis]|uniref:C-CAP/cofactor C-like domain-containing protein n=1 Tax=Ceutorhynchus assimilis TaxID=467358 RepID=A0A9N9QRT0_9CUCU|nr:unnamed protein product [Ceutorhynchus assimilis]
MSQFEAVAGGFPLAQYLKTSQAIGGVVAEHSKLVQGAFQAQLAFLYLAEGCSRPTSQDSLVSLLKPTSDKISAIQEYAEKHRSPEWNNHLTAISTSIPALGWVTLTAVPAPYVKEMKDAGQYYTNKVLKEWKNKDEKHVEWAKAWMETLEELRNFVFKNHTTGLVWAGKTPPPAGGCPPPPPPGGCPPPPPIIDFDLKAAGDGGLDRSALFAEINKGENITRSLKKVTSDMQTHKNTGLRQGPVPQQANKPSIGVKPVLADKPPVFARDGKKWLIEYQKNKTDLVVENAEMNNVVYLFKCENTTVQVKGKINSITMDSCKKTAIVFDNLVSCMEFINCQSVQMQALGKVPTVSIDKTDGCQVYLSKNSLDVEIISSKSSEMNVLVPEGDDYVEHAVPEQFKTRITPKKTLHTEIVENKG